MRDSGHASVEMALAAGVLLLPVVLTLLAFGPWLEKSMLVESLAAEAARAAVVTRNFETAAALIDEARIDRSIAAEDLTIGWCGDENRVVGTERFTCEFSRGSRIEAAVSLWTPMFVTPWGNVGGLWVTGTHSEPIDSYRSLDRG